MIKYQDINGVRLAFDREDGQGPAVVLMHGWGCNSSTLASIAATVRAMGRTLINIDMPGSGASSEPPVPWGTEEYCAAIEELLRREEVGPDAVMLGHSNGGRIAILYASRNPLGKLILVDAAGVKHRRPFKVYVFKALKNSANLLLGKKRARKPIERLRKLFGSADYNSSSPMMKACMSLLTGRDLCDVMPLIKAPTLLIWGDRDTATPPADAKKMEKLIPNAGLVMFPGAGHYSFLDNPGQFAAVLQSFLNS